MCFVTDYSVPMHTTTTRCLLFIHFRAERDREKMQTLFISQCHAETMFVFARVCDSATGRIENIFYMKRWSHRKDTACCLHHFLFFCDSNKIVCLRLDAIINAHFIKVWSLSHRFRVCLLLKCTYSIDTMIRVQHRTKQYTQTHAHTHWRSPREVATQRISLFCSFTANSNIFTFLSLILILVSARKDATERKHNSGREEDDEGEKIEAKEEEMKKPNKLVQPYLNRSHDRNEQ